MLLVRVNINATVALPLMSTSLLMALADDHLKNAAISTSGIHRQATFPSRL